MRRKCGSFFFFKMMAWKDTQMFSSNLFTESAASDKTHLVISLFLSSVFRMLMLRTLVFLEPSPCHVLFSDSVAHSHDNALKIRTLGLREREAVEFPQSHKSHW